MNDSNHFDSIADVFNRVWHFSQGYKEFVISHILEDLDLNSSDTLVDIGGGTGTFTSSLFDAAKLHKAYCIEPSAPMCEQAERVENITALCADAHEFCTLSIPYSKLLCKEVIHHIDERERFWRNVYEQLPIGGKLLIITRPQKVAFPFFERLRTAFEANQPDHLHIADELAEAGFTLKIHQRTHTFTLHKERWYEMLRYRFMSDLAPFSDEEIESGIMEIDAAHPFENLEIIDHLIFITATK